MAKGYLDSSELIDAATSNQVSDEDRRLAKLIKEEFLAYEHQLWSMRKLLASIKDEHKTDGDRVLESQVHDLTKFLSDLKRGNSLQTSALLSFAPMLKKLADDTRARINNKSDTSTVTQRLREEKNRVIEEGKEQDRRFSKLEDRLGQTLDAAITKTGGITATATGGLVKTLLAGVLGAGAPLVTVLDDFLQIEDKIKGFTSGILRKTNGLIRRGISSVRGSVTDSKVETLNKLKGVEEGQAARQAASDKWLAAIASHTKNMRTRLGNIQSKIGGFATTLLTGLGTVFSGLFKKIFPGGFSLPSPKGLAGGMAGRALPLVAGGFGLYSSLKDLHQNKTQGGLQRGANYATAIASGALIGSVVPAIGTAVGAAVGGLAAAVADNSEHLESFAKALKVWGKELLDGVREFFSWGANKAGEAWEGAKSGLSSLADDGKKKANAVVEATSSAASTAYKGAQNAYATVKGNVQERFNQVHGYVSDAASRVGESADTLLRYARVESNFNPAPAKAATSSAGGLFQFTDGTWRGMLKKHGHKYGLAQDADKTDPRANSLMAAELTKENRNYLSNRLKGRELSDTDVYMAHFLGGDGAVKFLTAKDKDPNAVAADLLPTAAKANASVFYADKAMTKPKTVGEIYASYQAKLSAPLPTATRTPSTGVDASGAAVVQAKPKGYLAIKQAEAGAASTVFQQNSPVAKVQQAPSVIQSPVPEAKAMQKPPAPVVPNNTATTQQGAQGTTAKQLPSRASLGTIPFLPDDASLLMLNIADLLG